MNNDLGYNYDLKLRYKCERWILGKIMANASTGEVFGCRKLVEQHQLMVDDFRDQLHKSVFLAIIKCYENDQPPDLMMVLAYRPNEYRKNNSGEYEFFLASCIDLSYVGLHSLHENILILKQYVLMDFWNDKAKNILYGNWNGRDVIMVGDNIINDYTELMDRMTGQIKSTVEVKDDYEDEIVSKVKKLQQGLSVGVPTTIPDLDHFLQGGWFNGEVVIIAGRPGMGKTTFSLICSWESYKRSQVPTLFFSIEMPKNQLKNKLISLETGIPYHDIKGGRLTNEQLQAVLACNKYIDESQFYILDKTRYLHEIVAQTGQYVAEKNVGIIYIDYIQRIKTNSNKKIREEITEITRELKTIAKDNYIPVVALSQLSRAVESRVNKRPLLSDLKESGSIEEDADIVAFLYRDAYYQLQQNMAVSPNELYTTEVIIGKGRDLGNRTIRTWIDPIRMIGRNYNPNGYYD